MCICAVAIGGIYVALLLENLSFVDSCCDLINPKCFILGHSAWRKGCFSFIIFSERSFTCSVSLCISQIVILYARWTKRFQNFNLLSSKICVSCCICNDGVKSCIFVGKWKKKWNSLKHTHLFCRWRKMSVRKRAMSQFDALKTACGKSGWEPKKRHKSNLPPSAKSFSLRGLVRKERKIKLRHAKT